MNTLQTYITDTQRLLHDASFNFWTLQELTDYVNKARKLVAAVSGCTRQLRPLNIAAATTRVGATMSMDTMVVNRRVIDVMDIMLQYTSTTCYPLKYLSPDDAKRLGVWQYQTAGTPSHYTIIGRSVIILPYPAIAYANNDFDLALEPQDLVNVTDQDNDLAFPYTEPVGFYAAYLAKKKYQRDDQAQTFLADYKRRITEAIGTEFSRRLIGQ